MTKKDQLEELEKLKARVHALEKALAAVIDVLKEEMQKTDSYGLFKRWNKWFALPAMTKRLDDAKEWISSAQ